MTRTVIEHKTPTTPTFIGSQEPRIPQISVTTNYGQFRLLGGNRVIDYNHVKELKREIEANPELLPSNPISVNEHLFIIDGQHRRQAAQELGVPLYYIVTPGLTLNATRHLNTTQRRWTLLDFAHSYADSGREDYILFLRLHNEYPKIAPSILRMYLAGGYRHQLSNDFKRGEFQISDKDTAVRNVGRLAEVIHKTHVQMNSPMVAALLALSNGNEDFNWGKFMQKLDNESARNMFEPRSTMRNCLRSIEDTYNFQSKYPVRLY